MEVYVFKEAIESGKVFEVLIDGSGEGISGPGIYMEYMWSQTMRKFIKQHAMIDAATRRPIAVCITLESPGDSSVFPALVQGAINAGVKISKVYADGAYDSIENWKLAGKLSFDFEPNLKEKFGEKSDLPERNSKLLEERLLGKTAYHIASGYNTRWHVEVFFSVFKKLFGERVRNRLFSRMVLAMRFKYSIMDVHKKLYNNAMAEVCA